MSGNTGKAKTSNLTLFPPIPFRHLASAVLSEERTDAKWRVPHDRRVTCGKPGNRIGIEVVIVVVRKNYDVDWWQAIEFHRRGDPPPRSKKLYR